MKRYGVLGLVFLAMVWAGNQCLIGQNAKKTDIHDPAVAVANLEVHPELKATLFVSEPKITNPTNLDIDHRGRVWICDVVNYRGNNGKRSAGDRILILEDTNGDGVADTEKTFYQGRDIDSAMGICVLGDKVIVSATPNVFVFTFDPATDKVLKKELLFTKTGQPQHDHSAHSFLFGPDGKLYWNFGNTGQAVHDKDGKPVVDLAGNKVVDNGKPYWGGMVFRCDMDGSNFETLGHNFRNNYEVTVDSFGTLWQSDNDDDGNRGVRINYVMEFGNYGYRDEITGAGWNTKRTNLESDTPLRHWHLNDPGVVPNLLQTGGGSPTGICLYEGSLLPKAFHGQPIHCDAGPSIVRGYHATRDGAGYKAEIVNVLDGQKKNNWFRPADVGVAPDGSIFVTDWYDPGVGGHAQRDLDRGRIFRVAPPGVKYSVPKFDFSSNAGLIEAMKNPNLAVRYLAWTKLHQQGAGAEADLLKLWASTVPHEKARALWLLGKIPGKGQHYVDVALQDKNADLRVTGLRLARELKLDLIPLVRKLLQDESPAVLRECAIALRHHQSPDAPELWAELAKRHDGKDRWYLEALGIAADKQWDRYLEAYLRLKSEAGDGKAHRDIVWRSRAVKTPALFASVITSKSTPTDELPRFFRAFDFQPASEAKDQVLVDLAFSSVGDVKRQGIVSGESIARLKNFNIQKQPKYASALKKVLEEQKGTAGFVDLVAKFNVVDRYPELLALAQKSPNEQVGVDAMRTLLERDQDKLVRQGIVAKDLQVASNTLIAIGNAGHPRANGQLLDLVNDGKADLELRRLATRALGGTKAGSERLLALASNKKLAKELEPAAASVLAESKVKEVKNAAAKLFPRPAGANAIPIPPISDLVKLKGNAEAGALAFAKVGTCANCHIVNKQGKDVGPELSEIGKKLAKEAMYEAILYPSASIAHNYETWVAETKQGEVFSGLLVSKTPDEIVLKNAEGLTRSLKQSVLDSVAKSPVSIMPADLTKNLSFQDLANIVEYLSTLKEAKK